MTQDIEDRPSAGWGAFALKMLLAIAWLVVLGVGDWLLQRGDGYWPVAGGLLVAAPAFLWLVSLMRRARIDELEDRLAIHALAQGAWWAVAFGATLYGLMSAIGQPPSATLLIILPWGAFVFGEIMGQASRRALARR